MTYPRGLDEYDDEALVAELVRRGGSRRRGKCSYCHRDVGAEMCAQPTQHVRTAREWNTTDFTGTR